MKIPADAIIGEAKLLQYLLRRRPEGDKSSYFARGGFTFLNPRDLERAIRDATAASDAVEDHRNEFGVFYAIETVLKGVNGIDLGVRIIWQLRADNTYSLVTVVPSPRRS
jgi:hypothetical protein